MKKPAITLHAMGQWQDTLKTVIAVLAAHDLIEIEGSGSLAEEVRRRAAALKAGNPLDGTRLWDNS